LKTKHNQFVIDSITFDQNSRQMKNFSILLISLLLLACSDQTKTVSIKDNQDEAFNQFKETMVLDMWRQYPVWASYQGFHQYDEELPAPNDDTRSAGQEFWNNVQFTLDTFDIDKLNKGNQIDFYIIKDQVASNNFYNNEFKSHEWDPSAFNIGGSFYQVLNYQELELEERIDKIHRKLEKVEEYYRSAEENIIEPTKVHLELAIQQLEGSISIFKNNILDSLESSNMEEEYKDKFRIANNRAILLIEDFVINLKEDLNSFKKNEYKSFRIGKEMFLKKFEHDIQSTYNATEIYNFAVQEKEELLKKMAKISQEIWSKYYPDRGIPNDRQGMIKDVIEAVSQTHVHRDSFITSIRKQIPELEKFVQDNNLITLDPEKPLVVRETPKYMRGFAGASISAPGPYDKNAETYYNVTPLDHYSAEEAESYLREYNDYTLQILNIHEAIPGHYTQLVYSNKAPSIIKSLFGNGAMIEGWAVYTELMMLENGYGNNNPEMMLMYYKWNLRTVCNTILDYGIHVNNLSEEEALNLLMADAFQEKSEAEGKWRRARLSQVQLCSYFTGFYEIRALREEMKKIRGDNFDLKIFHEEFLSYGSAPVKYIRELMIKSVEVKKTLS
jgi:uncharacterized protein (DUF885 family)